MPVEGAIASSSHRFSTGGDTFQTPGQKAALGTNRSNRDGLFGYKEYGRLVFLDAVMRFFLKNNFIFEIITA